MANIVRKGFWPAEKQTRKDVLFPVDAANGSAIYRGDLVKMVAAGAVNASSAGDANIIVGSVLEILDSNKRPVGSWYSSVSTKYLPASTAGYVLVALALPGRLFIAETGTIITSAAIGASTDHVVGSGSTTTGESGGYINAGDLNTGGQVFIIGPVDDPLNDITLASAHWYVMFNESIFMGTGKSTGV